MAHVEHAMQRVVTHRRAESHEQWRNRHVCRLQFEWRRGNVKRNLRETFAAHHDECLTVVRNLRRKLRQEWIDRRHHAAILYVRSQVRIETPAVDDDRYSALGRWENGHVLAIYRIE